MPVVAVVGFEVARLTTLVPVGLFVDESVGLKVGKVGAFTTGGLTGLMFGVEGAFTTGGLTGLNVGTVGAFTVGGAIGLMAGVFGRTGAGRDGRNWPNAEVADKPNKAIASWKRFIGLTHLK